MRYGTGTVRVRYGYGTGYGMGTVRGTVRGTAWYKRLKRRYIGVHIHMYTPENTNIHMYVAVGFTEFSASILSVRSLVDQHAKIVCFECAS